MQPFDHDDNVQYWDIIFNAQSFLYRQIRRMMGALVAVAKGKITHRHIYEMLTIPSLATFSNRINVLPSDGLYLADIEFREKCLIDDANMPSVCSENYNDPLRASTRLNPVE